MLGSVRFFMASCVVLFHLTLKVPNIGMLAVNYFYVISGFLITMVLHEVYKFNLVPFAKNRLLRLYPAYLAVLAISIPLYWIDGFSSFHITWSSQPNLTDMVKNITLLPFAFIGDSTNFVNFLNIDSLQNSTAGFRLIPPSWSVAIEVCCYLILWAFTARSLLLTFFTLVLSAIWHLYSASNGLPELYRYSPIPAALLPFSLGALAYHLSRIMPKIVRPRNDLTIQIWLAFACLVAFLLNWYATSVTGQNFLNSPYYYTNTLLAFLTVTLINKSRLNGASGKIDKILGDLAYPLFLSHFAAGFIASKVLDIDQRGWMLFLAGYPIAVAISIAVVKLVDDPLSKLRDRIRDNANAPSKTKVLGLAP